MCRTAAGPRRVWVAGAWLALGACSPSGASSDRAPAPQSPVIEVLHAEGSTPAPPPEPAPPTAGCRIGGTGERPSHGDTEPPAFELWGAAAGGEPRAVVRFPAELPATWSALPQPGARALRARVALDGDRLVRIEAYASLRGRAFQLLAKSDVHGTSLWLRRSARVEVLGADGSDVEVRLLAPAPNDLRASTRCDALRYDRETLDASPADGPRTSDQALELVGPELSLSDTPGAPPFAHLRLGDATVWAFETRDAAIHVSGATAEIGFDAWAPASELAPASGRLGSLWGEGLDSVVTDHVAVVARDLPFAVGARPPGEPFGVLEAGARAVLWQDENGATRFDLDGHEVEPAAGLSFYLRTRDVTAPGAFQGGAAGF